jgi:chaperone required for assembly of F1-ATPase
MSEWKNKVFWSEVAVEPFEGQFCITLDGRKVKTPAKQTQALPNQAMAEKVAEEWRAQVDVVRPETMPATRLANAAIDKVSQSFAEVAEMIGEYAGTDLLCYRAQSPAELVARQIAEWDPLLHWVQTKYNAPLVAAQGVMFIAQPEQSVERLKTISRNMSAFELSAFHDIVAMSGSYVLGLAVIEGEISPSEAWALSRLDESWQAEQWGVDEEAEEIANKKQREFELACEIYFALRDNR